MKLSRLAILAFALALVVVVVDQLTKIWMIDGLHLQEIGRIEIWPPIFHFSWVENRGVSFGLFGGGSARWFLAAFSVIVAVALAVWALKADRKLLAVALGLVMGGAIGNVIDRVRFGYVVDFLDFSGIGFFPWVFNVADSAITIGVIVLLIDSLMSERAAKVGAANEKS